MGREALHQIEPDPDALRQAVATLRRREIIHPTEDDDYTITVPLIAEYIRRRQALI